MDKKELRCRMIAQRDHMTVQERDVKSRQILEALWEWDAFRKANVILSYCSFRTEVDTTEINRRILKEGKGLFLPKTYPKEREMKFYSVSNLSDLVSGYQGILEPCRGEISFESCDFGRKEGIIMLMPGVACDGEGNRLGYGGGYYDRYLAKYEKRIETTCMLAFDTQYTEMIETELNDIRPKRIISNRR